MKKLLLLTATLLIAGGVYLAAADPIKVEAAEQDQSQEIEQEIEFECETEAYGQTRCWAKGKQKAEQDQYQRLVLGDSITRIAEARTADGVYYHQVVDSGLDTGSLAAAATTIVSGIGAIVYQIKSRLG